jgi:hypothetical protein
MQDALVSEFCTRETEPDASNRARYHCNACAEVFPLGSVTQMRTHLIACPSLSQATKDSIRQRIADELTSPKRVTRDPRWAKSEELRLLELDAELPSGKMDNKYTKMAADIGRSAQACRQKLIHLKEAKAAEEAAAEETEQEAAEAVSSDQNTEPVKGRIATRSSKASKTSTNALLPKTTTTTRSSTITTRSSKAIANTSPLEAITSTRSPKASTKPQTPKRTTKTRSANAASKTKPSNAETEPEVKPLFSPVQYKPVFTAKAMPRRGARKVRFQPVRVEKEAKIEPETKMESRTRSAKAAKDAQTEAAKSPPLKPSTAYTLTKDIPMFAANPALHTVAQIEAARKYNPNGPIAQLPITARRTRVLSDIQLADAVNGFVRLVRWNIHEVLTKYNVLRRFDLSKFTVPNGFYTSNLAVVDGWDMFVVTGAIPAAEKDKLVAKLIGLWLEELEIEGFERGVDAKIEEVIEGLAEWPMQGGNEMKKAKDKAKDKAKEELTTDEEESGYDADRSDEVDAAGEEMEL